MAHDDGGFTPADGALAPPMENGELVFDAPWQGRAFGMARVMAQAGLFRWDDFRQRLMDVLAEHAADQPFAYYDCFLLALERVSMEGGLVSAARLSERVEAFRARAHGHDH